MITSSISHLFQQEKDCCGCTACMNICPTQAISMTKNSFGETFPTIHHDACTNCRLCHLVCPMQSSPQPEKSSTYPLVYAVRAKDAHVVQQSSSGGMFTIISDYVLKIGGIIASAVYNYDTHQLEYRLYHDLSTRDQARGSKYIQPILGNIYNQCIQWMQQNPDKPLLFVGLGCHVSGFHHILQRKNLTKNAILMDLICHGTPSAQLWKEYICYLEEKNGGKATYVTFKDKRYGWNHPLSYICIDDNEIPLTEYSYWFYDNFSLRDSCFHCKFTRLQRESDITIGDYWGIEKAHPHFYQPQGTSLVLIQSDKGRQLFQKISEQLHYEESSTDACLQPRLQSPGTPNPRREKFRKHYKLKGIHYLISHYHKPNRFYVFLQQTKKLALRLWNKVVHS